MGYTNSFIKNGRNNNWYKSFTSAENAKKKYGDDPYYKEVLKLGKSDGSRVWRPEAGVVSNPGLAGLFRGRFQGKSKVLMVDRSGGFNEQAFKEYVKYRKFEDAVASRAETAAGERSEFFNKDGAQPGAGADARDYSNYSSFIFNDLGKDDKRNYRKKSSQKLIDLYGSDPYFADFIKAGNNASVVTMRGRSTTASPNVKGYIAYITKRQADDAAAAEAQARINEAAGTEGTSGGGGGGTSGDGGGGTLEELINSGASEQDVIDAFLGEPEQGAGGGTTVDNGSGGGASLSDFLDTIQSIFGGGGAPTPPTNAPKVPSPVDPVVAPVAAPVAAPVVAPVVGAGDPVVGEGTLGEIVSPDPGYTIDSDGNILDANGNIIGTSSEAPQTPGYTIVDNIIYDADGNPIGTGNATETGEVIGGASPENPVFDGPTAEQIAAAEKAAQAVELMDAGYGRYNAAVRKLGIVGRQGEEYAPLILDQLRMAEMEAAQPQFAAFGFGQNSMLGGMPQVGVQGVQGNIGGQSALSALSNAGLNQLQVAQQPYNRIALPQTGLGGQPISQINNPTIFKASTSV